MQSTASHISQKGFRVSALVVVVAFLAAGVLLALGGVGAKSAQAQALPEASKIVYTCQRGYDNYEICAKDPNSPADAAPEYLTDSDAFDADPTLSPDGTKIIFLSSRDGNAEIYQMNSDGTGQTRLTNNAGLDRDPSISYDGTRIAFSSDRAGGGGDFELYEMNAASESETNQPEQLTSNTVDDSQPDFSPDGARLVFTSEISFNNADIFTMLASPQSEANKPKNLTNTTKAGESEPDFSPEGGTKIAFSKTNKRTGGIDIYEMNSSDGSGKRKLTKKGKNEFPDYSPDGSKIAFSRITRTGFDDIFTMNTADGSGKTRITNASGYDYNPSWEVAPPTTTP